MIPANRAMAYLKIKEWRKAEADCSLALSLDESYVKAYQRRGTARKNLKEYEKALEDFNHVLLLEAQNKQAKLEIEEVANLMVKEKEPKIQSPLKEKPSMIKGMFATNSTKKETIPGQIFPIDKAPHLRSSAPLKTIQIVEVGEPEISISKSSPAAKPLIEMLDSSANDTPLEIVKEEVKEEKKESKSKGMTQKVEKEINEKLIVQAKDQKWKKPNSAVQFYKTWAQLNNQNDKLTYLNLLNSADFPKLFKHSMEPSVFSSILETLPSSPKLSSHLLGLCRVPRLSALIMFLSSNEQNQLKQMVESVQEKLSPSEYKEIVARLCA